MIITLFRFDTQGYRAKHCTYNVININTDFVVAVYVAMKRQVSGGSGAMEPAAARCCLQFLEVAGVEVAAFCTDRSSSMRTMMATEFPQISHQFDIWHAAKNVSQSLAKEEKLKSCEIIRTWHPSIMRQWWWALQSSPGNSVLAKEKILSMFSHISGEIAETN